MRRHPQAPVRRGSVLVEFAVVALALYLVLALIIEFGRIMYCAQVTQSAADTFARELAKTPLPPAMTFGAALNTSQVRAQLYSPDFLVVDLDAVPGGDIEAYFRDNAPLVNQQLRPLMIVDRVSVPGSNLLRYPGHIKTDNTGPFQNEATNPGHLTIDVPILVNGDEGTITHVDVVEEVKPAAATDGPFSLTAAGPDWQRGTVTVRINYPYQAAALTAYPPQAGFPPEPNVLNPIEVPAGDEGEAGVNAGAEGLGRQYAFAKQVRPFRKVLTGQATARRELFAPLPPE